MSAIRKTTVVSNNKFHQLFGDGLKVALQARFRDPNSELRVLDDSVLKRNPKMRYYNGVALKAYHPAIAECDMKQREEGSIEFQPWVDVKDVASWQLVLQAKPFRFSGALCFPFRLQVTGEEGTRGFDSNDGGAYEDLPMSEEVDGEVYFNFPPVFVKVLNYDETVSYFSIALDVEELRNNRITLNTKRVDAGIVPDLLRNYDDF